MPTGERRRTATGAAPPAGPTATRAEATAGGSYAEKNLAKMTGERARRARAELAAEPPLGTPATHRTPAPAAETPTPKPAPPPPKPVAPTAQVHAPTQASAQLNRRRASTTAIAVKTTATATATAASTSTAPPLEARRRASLPAVVVPTKTVAARRLSSAAKPTGLPPIPLTQLLRTNPSQFTNQKIHVSERQVSEIDKLPARFEGVRMALLSGNRLTSLAGLAQFSSLTTLSAAHNKLDGVQCLHDLATACPHLTRLMLDGNPVSRLPTYRARVLILFPKLAHLDSRAVTDDERAAAAPAVRREADALALMFSNTCVARKISRVRALLRTGTALLDMNLTRDAPARRYERAAAAAIRPPDIALMLRMWDYEGSLDDADRRQIDAENLRAVRRVLSDEAPRAVPDPSDSVPKAAAAWDGIYAKAMSAQQTRIQALLTSVEHARAERAELVERHASRAPAGAMAAEAEAAEAAETARRDEREALISELRDDLDDVRYAYLAGGTPSQRQLGLPTPAPPTAHSMLPSPSPAPAPRTLFVEAHRQSANPARGSPAPQPAPPPPLPVPSLRPRSSAALPAPAPPSRYGAIPGLDEALFGTPLHLPSSHLAEAVRASERAVASAPAHDATSSKPRPSHAARSPTSRVEELEMALSAAQAEAQTLRRSQGAAARALTSVARAGRRELAARMLARRCLLRRTIRRWLSSMPRVYALRAKHAMADALLERRAERRRAACFGGWRYASATSASSYPPELEQAGMIAAHSFRRDALMRRGMDALRHHARLDDIPLGAAGVVAEIHARRVVARTALKGMSAAASSARLRGKATAFTRRRIHRKMRRTFEAWRRVAGVDALRRRLESAEMQLAVRRDDASSLAPTAASNHYRLTSMPLDDILSTVVNVTPPPPSPFESELTSSVQDLQARMSAALGQS